MCSSGGHFVKLSGGGCEYQGGETRLVQVPNFCRFADLLNALERITSSAAASSSASSEQVVRTTLPVHAFLASLTTPPPPPYSIP